MNWTIKFLEQANKTFQEMERNQALKVAKAIKKKLMVDPIQYGDPLGSKGNRNLTGFFSIRVDDRNLRVVYLVYDGVVNVVLITVIADRADHKVHDEAAHIAKQFSDTFELLQKASKVDSNDFQRIIKRIASGE